MDFTNANQKTIRVYEDNVALFAEKTASVCNNLPQTWIDLGLELIGKNGTVLEIGSATGRDAAYIQGLGYSIRCTDVVEGFLKTLAQRGLNPDKLNAITDELGGPYDMILANCVFLHFRKKELHAVLEKCFTALTGNGILACSFMLGSGEAWRDHKVAGRYFHLWRPEEIITILRQHGFKTIYMRTGDRPEYADKFYIIGIKTGQNTLP